MTEYTNKTVCDSIHNLSLISELNNITCNHDKAESDDADMSNGITIIHEFHDPDNLLESALNDIKHYFNIIKVKIRLQGGFPIIIRHYNAREFETYRLNVYKNRCLIESGDIEGIRRAIYYFIDLMRLAEGAFVKCGRIERRAFIKTRISRCFFGPLKRPPLYHDELMDEVDYYPEYYLSRLAYESVNGLWLTVDFKSLGQSNIMPIDPDVEKRLDKLRHIVNKCRRYGIKIYLYCCEPIAFDENDPILQKHPQLAGTMIPGKRGFCPSSELAQKYLRQILYNIFSAVPRLGGMIVLSVGEWHTLCCNFPGYTCPNCGNKPPWEPLGLSLKAMEQGMHQANPDAELISWPYTQVYYWGYDSAVEAASKVPANVKLMHNFESAGARIQLGKRRIISDYWLSYIGPSNFFAECTAEARKNNTPMYAKLQVGCAWECVTTQYLPIPGNLYEKYRRMLKLGISGVMQSWYFGAFPSLMTRAAGILSFEPFPNNPRDFLKQLAQLNWGQKYAKQVVKAWELFSKAYEYYPLCNDLGYIGPVHDSVVWFLHLKPVNRRLAPSWLSNFPAPGDRILECISNHNDYDQAFTLDEVIELTDKMLEFWNTGLEILKKTPARSNACEREIGIGQANYILIAGTNAIFKFYKLREKMIFGEGVSRLNILKKLKKIVEEQICLSEQMLPLIAADPSIGFHSESEGYKFTAETINKRIEWLRAVLLRDFPYAEKRIKAGMTLYPEYTGETIIGPYAQQKDNIQLRCYGRLIETYRGAYNNFKFVELKGQTPPLSSFRIEFKNNFIDIELYAEKPAASDRFILRIETEKLTWSEQITIYRNGSCLWHARNIALEPEIDEEENFWKAKVKIAFSSLKTLNHPLRPIRINIMRTFQENNHENTLSWIKLNPLKNIFILGWYNPDDFGWIIP